MIKIDRSENRGLNMIYLESINLANVFSTIFFSFGVIVLCLQMKKFPTNSKWIQYKILIQVYLLILVLIYLYVRGVIYHSLSNFGISEENLIFLNFLLPYFLKMMSNLSILSHYDLFRNTKFALLKVGG
jgi:hypothetical protein